MKRIWSYLVPLLILVGVLVLQYQFPLQVEAFRIKVFDVFQQIKPRVYTDTPVRIIDIDDESLEKLGQWPWPRTLIADLVTRLAAGGAKSIAFDIVFAEPDRTSPKKVVASLPVKSAFAQVRAQMDLLPDHDVLFAEAIAKAPVVLAFGLTPETHKTVPQLKSGFAELSRGADRAIDYVGPVRNGAVTDLPEFEKSARGNGCFNMGMELDSTIRRAPALFRLNETLCPALVLEAIRVQQGASTYKIKLAGASGETSFGEKTGIVGIKVGRLDIPTDNKGRIWLYDTGYRSERFIPAWKVLSDDFDLKTLEGSILFIGSSATGIKDLRSTPLNPRAPGVEVHAQLAEQILLGNFLRRPDWADGAEFTYLVLLGLLLIILLPLTGAILCAAIGISAIAFAFGFSWYAFDKMHLLLDPVFPSIVVLLIYLVSSFLNFLRTERERGQIRSAFSRYLSPELVKKLAKDPKQLKLGGEVKTMTFLFTDIRGFTSLSETLSAHELTQFMNSYLTPMTDIILRHDGTIDKYIGDCIMAFWNAPLEDKDHARHACLAGTEMLKFLKEWNDSRREEAARQGKAFREIAIGVGINTGEACVGNMGSEYRFDYTVLGDEVNLASRLEGLTKQYGVAMLIGQNTADRVADLSPRELDTIQVRGKTKPTKIFTLS
jgi:adenylate cyclase